MATLSSQGRVRRDAADYAHSSARVTTVPDVRANRLFANNIVNTSPVEYLSTPGALSLGSETTLLDTTGGALALTLADGTPGQRKVVIHVAGTADATLTPDHLLGGTAITTAAPGASYTLTWTNGAWAATAVTGSPSGLPPVGAVTLPAQGPADTLAVDAATGQLVLADPRTRRYGAVPARPAYKLLIYYGYPSLLNGIPTLAGVAQAISEYDVVVFGDGIQDPGHPDHANLQVIMDTLRALHPATLVAGYVDLGVSTQNLSEAQMIQRVGWWADMGADLIFWDDAGFDFLVTRDRQNFAVATSHAAGLGCFMNAFNTDDLFLGSPAPLLGPADWFLLESLPYNDGGVYVATANWEPRASLLARVAKALGHRANFGSRIAATSLVNYTAYTNDAAHYLRATAQAVCFAAGLDAYGDNAGPSFSAGGATANTIFKGAYDEAMGAAGAAIKPSAVITIPAGAAPAALARFDYQTLVYFDETFATPTWAAVTPKTRAPLAPQGLAGGVPPAGLRGRIATNTAGVYAYDDGAAWAGI